MDIRFRGAERRTVGDINNEFRVIEVLSGKRV